MMIGENPRVTWLLPVKNGMPYLPEALASIAAQTYRNFEVMAWDNGSDDESVAELRRWIPHRIPGTIKTDEPLPLGDCLASMIAQSRTELCARFDADDVNLPDRLELQVRHLVGHPEIGVLGGQSFEIDSEGRWLPSGPLPLEHENIVSSLAVANPMVHPSTLLRRSVVLRAGNYRKVGPPSVNIEDYDLWFRVALISRLENLSDSLIYHRTHERSTTYLADQRHLLRPAMAECYYEYASQLFGNNAAEAKLLQSRRHPLIFLSMLRMARFRAKQSGASTMARLFSEPFLNIGRDLVPRWDLPTRMILAALVGRGAGVWNELGELGKDVLKLLGLFSLVRRAKHGMKDRSSRPNVLMSRTFNHSDYSARLATLVNLPHRGPEDSANVRS